MCKKLICVTSFVFVLALAGVSMAQVDPALVGWWKFDEGAGITAADSSGNENQGTLHGPVEWVAEGQIGAALSFNGPYNYVLVQDSPSLDPTDAITIAAWVNPNWTGNNRILQKSEGTGDNQYRFLKEWGDNIRLDLPGVGLLEVTGYIPPVGEWTHLAGTYDGSSMKIYYDAEVVGEMDASGTMQTSSGTLCIGTKHETAPAGDEYHGMMDDVRIYNRALTQGELAALGGDPKAHDPFPADRAIHEDTWATLTWVPGYAAASHDLYMSTKLDDVQYGTVDAFQGNMASPYFVVGFPGFLYPEGLQPGTTYYWRVDEVNETNPDSPWKGDVWRFTVPPKTAWKPMPPDKARLVNVDTDLSWTPGWGAKLHTVYFGDTFDDVNDATGGSQQVETTYALDTLELDKTYYWRIDEFDGATTYKGDVWSFTTGEAALGGIKAEYFNNLNLVGTPVLTQVEPFIDYTWDGSPAPGVEEDNFSVRWTGMLNVPFTETYTFYANVQGAIRLWVDDQLLIDFWMQHPMIIEYQGKIDLEVGIRPVVMEFADWQYDAGEAAVAQLFWENPSSPREIIPQTSLLLPVWAIRARPSDGTVDVSQRPILRWTAGDDAVTHQIYFGTDENAVLNADTSSPEYKGDKSAGEEKFDPGQLEWGVTYYWRVDEINGAGTVLNGDVWSFTTANFLVVDDFENYTDDDAAGEAIWQTWVDGFGVAENGATVGYLVPPYTEQVVIHGGRQSMPLGYDNSVADYSEVELALSGMDLTQNGGATLTIWFRGDLDNATEPMYVALDDAAVYHSDSAAAQVAIWTEWNVDLQAFVLMGADPANASKIALGLGDKSNPQAGGSGTMYFDDIAVH